MSGRIYRTELEIITDILQVIMETGVIGTYITTLVRNANLSHHVALDKTGKLVKADLVKISEGERNRVFVITEKGIKFFHELREIKGLIDSNLLLGNRVKGIKLI
ncbi:MAG: winged helix-turn-helix domain-containing protein [Nitrososphaera sp.]|jgi:predicted transcriptional regulator